jgi:hypothetical protein
MVEEKLGEKGVRVISTARDWLTFMGQTMEETTRLAAYNKGKGKALRAGASSEEAGRIGSQRAADLMNFGEVGEVGRFLSNAGVPYSNIPYQVTQAHLKALRRTKSGKFSVDNAVSADVLKNGPLDAVLAKVMTLPQVSILRGA